VIYILLFVYIENVTYFMNNKKIYLSFDEKQEKLYKKK